MNKIHVYIAVCGLGKASATATAPSLHRNPLDVRPSEPVYGQSTIDPNYDFLQDLPSTSAQTFPAVITPSTVPFNSPTQPGYMDTNTVQYENTTQGNNPLMQFTNGVPVTSSQMQLQNPTCQMQMLSPPIQNNISVQSPQSMTSSSVTSPQPPQSPMMNNMGKFKTVAIAGTNQWLLIDQFGKPLLVLGGQNDEVSTVQELPSLSSSMNYVNSPPQYDPNSYTPSMNQGTVDMLAINPLSNSSENDLEVDNAGETGDYPSTSRVNQAEATDKQGQNDQQKSSTPTKEMCQQAEVVLTNDSLDDACASMEKMSLELDRGKEKETI